MAVPCKGEGCARRTNRLERSLCEQKEENERLQLCIEKRCVQQEEEMTRCDERLRVQKEEYEERLRGQKEEHKKALALARDAVVECVPFYGYYPLPLEDFPLEIIALIADFVDSFDDLARMSLASRRLHNGVLLSRQWIVVEEIVAATYGDVEERYFCLHDRRRCAHFACGNGLVRCLRALGLSRAEVTIDGCSDLVLEAAAHGQLDVIKHLHTTYALTALELWSVRHHIDYHPMVGGACHLPVIKYLHTVMGMEVPLEVLDSAAEQCLETMKYLHTDIGLTVEDVRTLDGWPIWKAAFARGEDCGGSACARCEACARERLVCLRDMYGVTMEDARLLLVHDYPVEYEETRRLQEVFGMFEM